MIQTEHVKGDVTREKRIDLLQKYPDSNKEGVAGI